MSIRNQFTDASAGRQASIVLLAVLVLGAMAALLFFSVMRTEYRPAFSGLQPADAATIVAELEKRKLPYQVGDGGRTILLPADRADAIRLDIMGSDLPLKGTVGFELFNKSDMGLTDFAQKINYQRALQGELARTILAMDGVESVRVHLALGEDRLFREDRVPPKASVLLQMREGSPVSEETAQGIQRLVAAAVDKLDPVNVVILGETGAVASVTAVPAAMGDGSPIGQEKRAIEAFYEARIRMAIDKAYPAEPIAVRVWADMRANPDTREDRIEELAWSPDHRTFRLHVSLSLKRALASGAQQDVESLTANAIGFDPSLGDAINFGPLPQDGEGIAMQPPLSQSARAEAVPSIDLADDAATPPVSRTIIVVTGLALVLGTLFVWQIARRRKRLARPNRRAFADRLNMLVQEEERARGDLSA